MLSTIVCTKKKPNSLLGIRLIMCKIILNNGKIILFFYLALLEKAYSQWLLSSTVMFINITKICSNLFSLIINSVFFLFQTKNTFSSVSSLLMIRLWQPLYNATSNKFCVTMFSSLCHVQQQTYIKCLFWNNTTHYLCIWNVINKNS